MGAFKTFGVVGDLLLIAGKMLKARNCVWNELVLEETLSDYCRMKLECNYYRAIFFVNQLF